MTATLHIFTKPGCSHCETAKTLLESRGLPFEEHSTSTRSNADAAIMLSGQTILPQIFLGTYHIGGAEALDALHKSGRLDGLLKQADEIGVFQMPSADQAAKGAEDVQLSAHLSVSDGSRDEDPEAWPILRFYKEFFGFWPNTFLYLHHWPEAYKRFVYCHNFVAVRSGKDLLGPELMARIGFASSKAQGCSYCQTHSVAWGAAAGSDADDTTDNTPKGRFYAAIERLAARAARNSVSAGVLGLVANTGKELGLSEDQIKAHIDATALVAAAFGFLNIFNDLAGVEIEGDWAKTGEEAGIEAGRHGVGAANPDNLSYDLPEGGPSLQEMLQRYNAEAVQADDYLIQKIGHVPGWLSTWPKQIQPFHAQLYEGLMQPDQYLSAELKHLVARVFALAKGAEAQAAEEAAMAIMASDDVSRGALRAGTCLAVAQGRFNEEGLFDPKEIAALKVALLSAHIPLTIPHAWIGDALEHYDTKGLVHIFVICGLASLIQRFAAIRSFENAPGVDQFLSSAGAPTDLLSSTFPVPSEVESYL